MKYLAKAFQRILDNSRGERAATAFLKQNPLLLIRVFNAANNTQLVCPEFRFGNQYRADFCVLSAHSGGWEVGLIELEPVGDRFFLKDGTESKKLRDAKRQVADWSRYIQTHDQEFRDELTRSMTARNIYLPRINRGLVSVLGEVNDCSLSFRIRFYIVMGRRKQLSTTDVSRRSYYPTMNNCDLVTYDRILDDAIELDYSTRAVQQHRMRLVPRKSQKPRGST